MDQASIPDHSVAQTPVSAFLATWDNLLGEMMRSSWWWWCCICSTTAKETLNRCTREIYGAKLKFRCCQIACLSGPAWACHAQDALINTCAWQLWERAELVDGQAADFDGGVIGGGGGQFTVCRLCWNAVVFWLVPCGTAPPRFFKFSKAHIWRTCKVPIEVKDYQDTVIINSCDTFIWVFDWNKEYLLVCIRKQYLIWKPCVALPC